MHVGGSGSNNRHRTLGLNREALLEGLLARADFTWRDISLVPLVATTALWHGARARINFHELSRNDVCVSEQEHSLE